MSDKSRDKSDEKFPAVGHRYLVDFKAFRVELDFASETSMTYYNLDQNGQRVGQKTVTIAVEPIRDGLFLMTWTASKSITKQLISHNLLSAKTESTISDTKPMFHYFGSNPLRAGLKRSGAILVNSL